MIKPLVICSLLSIIFGFNLAWAEDIPLEIRSYVSAKLTQYRFFNGRLKEFGSDTYSDEQPWFFVQDFNGDNKIDWIGFLAKDIPSDHWAHEDYIYDLDLICICSTQDSYIDINLIGYVPYVANDNSVSAGIFLRRPGTYSSQVEEQGEIKTSVHSIEYTDFEKSSRIIFWNGNAFSELWTAD